MQAFPLIMNFIMMPLFFLSGALFPVEGLPEPIRLIAMVNPLAYGVDALRATLTHASHFGFAIDFAVLSGITAICIGIGSYLFSKIEI